MNRTTDTCKEPALPVEYDLTVLGVLAATNATPRTTRSLSPSFDGSQDARGAGDWTLTLKGWTFSLGMPRFR